MDTTLKKDASRTTRESRPAVQDCLATLGAYSALVQLVLQGEKKVELTREATGLSLFALSADKGQTKTRQRLRAADDIYKVNLRSVCTVKEAQTCLLNWASNITLLLSRASIGKMATLNFAKQQM